MNPVKPFARWLREQSPDAARRVNKTFICSVLFLDIVRYTEKSVAGQTKWKERFNRLLFESIKDISIGDRIILDTGDGAAVGFLGDPEDALFVAMEFRDSLERDNAAQRSHLAVRMGINLGPVKLITDINKQLNLIGDGINVAQRVMTFAQPGELLVSRSYFEVISRLSEEYAKLFRYHGLHEDKHVRKHEVYAVGRYEAGIETKTLSKRLEEIASRSRAVTPPRVGIAEPLGTAPPAVPETDTATVETGAEPIASNVKLLRPALAAVVVTLLIVVLVAFGRLFQAKTGGTEPMETPTAGAPSAVVPGDTHKADRESPRRIASRTPPRPAMTPPAAATSEPADGGTPAAARTAKPSNEAGAAKAVLSTLRLSVKPWGEVYIDGRRRGVCPPLTSVKLKPGIHMVEVRNTSFTPFKTQIQLRANQSIRFQHVFR